MSDSARSASPSRGWSYALHLLLVLLHPLSVFLLPWRVGARDARMAIGLLQTDPVRRRARLCAACYLGVAAAKVLLLTIALLLAAIILTRVFDLRLKAGVGWLGTVLMAIVSVGGIAGAGTLILTFTTSFIAATLRQKIWVDEWADPATALDGRWPPVSGRSNLRNIAGVLAVIPSTMVPVIGILLTIKNPSGGTLLIGTMAGIIPAIWIAPRVIARAPKECYPEQSHPENTK